jgi:hypothetical protein
MMGTHHVWVKRKYKKQAQQRRDVITFVIQWIDDTKEGIDTITPTMMSHWLKQVQWEIDNMEDLDAGRPIDNPE